MSIINKMVKLYPTKERLFGLTQKAVGTNKWIFRRLVANISVGGSKDENAVKAAIQVCNIYDTPKKLMGADVDIVTGMLNANKIRFAGRKAGYLVATAKILNDKHGGKVPSDRTKLEALPGVGRHVASVVLALGFGKNEFAVDLHVSRIAARMGLVNEKDSVKVVETKIIEFAKGENLAAISRAFVDFGKDICGYTANCGSCKISKGCAGVRKSAA